jgi:hypothetical protein
MAIRDRNRDEAYFDRFIDARMCDVQQGIDSIKRGDLYSCTLDGSPEEWALSIRYRNHEVMENLLKSIFASYSRGDPMPEVEERVRLLLSELGPLGYVPSIGREDLCIISLAVLVLDDRELRGIRRAIRPTASKGRSFWVFDLLLGYDVEGVEHEPAGEFEEARAVYGAPVPERPAELERQLSGWYWRMRAYPYWWESHKRYDRNDRYFGYWAVEYAALARRLGIDDSALADAECYPYELARWLDERRPR